MAADKLYDMAFLDKMSGGDQDFILEMINTFREVGPDYIQKANALLLDSNYVGLGKETHRVIPGVTFLGAKLLEGYLMHIEEYCKKGTNISELPGLVEKVCTTIELLIEEFITDFNLDS